MTLIERAAQRRRVRALASDVRAGSWARGRARTAQRDFVRRHVWVYLGAFSALLALTVVVSLLMPTEFLKGLVVGGFLVGGIAALWSLTIQVTGTAPVMMGDTAETWTAMELRRLQSRGWRIVNHVVLAKDDLDHVLVGPGGAYVIETKWSGSPWQSEFGQSRMRAAIAQAKTNARSLGLWHPVKSQGVNVQPVIVLWGGGRTRQDSIVRVDGATVITGNALRVWVNRLGGSVLTESQVSAVWSALDAQVALRDPSERAANPVPTSVTTLLLRCAVAVGCAVLGVLVVGRLLGAIDSGWVAVAAGAGLVTPGLAGARVGVLRFASLGWLGGVGLSTLALALLQILAWISA